MGSQQTMANIPPHQQSNHAQSLTSRRAFIRAGAALGTALVMPAKLLSDDSDPQHRAPLCLDYGLSFVRNTAEFNSVRMWIESRTTIIDPLAGSRTEYYQCGACKAENTFAKTDLFKPNNYDFTPIFGDGRVLIFRRHASAVSGYRQVKKEEEMWGPAELMLREPTAITELKTGKMIWDAVAAGLPLVTQTELRNPETGLSAIIECPVKTMNTKQKELMWQTDTGPIALPDLTRRYDPQIESLSLAYIAINAVDFADFVVECETPILADDEEVCKVFHYSKLLSFPATSRVFALGKL